MKFFVHVTPGFKSTGITLQTREIFSVRNIFSTMIDLFTRDTNIVIIDTHNFPLAFLAFLSFQEVYSTLK